MGDISEFIEDFVKIVRHNPDQLDQMVENAYDECDGEFSIDEIREAMVDIVCIEPPVIVKPSKVVVKRPQLRAHDSEGKSRKAHYREMGQKTVILDIVDKHPKGISKTAILGLLRKDNGHWRPIITRWLCQMVDDGAIKTNGGRFYPFNMDYETREREIYRLIYECIRVHGKRGLMLTEIAKTIKCNGGKTRYLVHQGLKVLEDMGYVEYKNRRWVWTR